MFALTKLMRSCFGNTTSGAVSMVGAILGVVFASCLVAIQPASALLRTGRVPSLPGPPTIRSSCHRSLQLHDAKLLFSTSSAPQTTSTLQRSFGYTYDRVVRATSVCNPTEMADTYHLRVPVDGMWACTIPDGFRQDSMMKQLGVCNPLGYAYSYHLRK